MTCKTFNVKYRPVGHSCLQDDFTLMHLQKIFKQNVHSWQGGRLGQVKGTFRYFQYEPVSACLSLNHLFFRLLTCPSYRVGTQRGIQATREAHLVSNCFKYTNISIKTHTSLESSDVFPLSSTPSISPNSRNLKGNPRFAQVLESNFDCSVTQVLKHIY